MYEMFTGRVPIEADTYMGVLTKHMFEAPLPLSQVPGASRELGALEDVTLKALAKRSEDRYASMNELIADLDRIVQIGAGGERVIAATIEGIRRPDHRAPREEAARRFQNLADELEPPARAEVTAAYANARERRVRLIGAFVVGGVLIAGASVLAVAVLNKREPRETAAPPAASATHVEPAAVPLAEPRPAPTPEPTIAPENPGPTAAPAGTTTPPQHPTSGTKPAIKPKKPASGEAEDPWAK